MVMPEKNWTHNFDQKADMKIGPQDSLNNCGQTQDPAASSSYRGPSSQDLTSALNEPESDNQLMVDRGDDDHATFLLITSYSLRIMGNLCPPPPKSHEGGHGFCSTFGMPN